MGILFNMFASRKTLSISHASTNKINVPLNSPTPTPIISPEMIRPFPKAAKRKARGGRKKGKTKILTDTPPRRDDELDVKSSTQ